MEMRRFDRSRSIGRSAGRGALHRVRSAMTAMITCGSRTADGARSAGDHAPPERSSASRRSTSASPADAPRTMATATARLSATTGDGTVRPAGPCGPRQIHGRVPQSRYRRAGQAVPRGRRVGDAAVFPLFGLPLVHPGACHPDNRRCGDLDDEPPGPASASHRDVTRQLVDVNTAPPRRWALASAHPPRDRLVRLERRLRPCGLEQLDRVARRVVEQDLLAARTDDDVVAKVRPDSAQRLDHG